MTPFLVVTMGVPAPTAVGTDLVYATATKMTGSAAHYRQRSVNLQVALFLGIGSIPASLLGVATLELIERSYDAATVRSIMVTIIAATLVLVGASLIFRIFYARARRVVRQGRGLGRRLLDVIQAQDLHHPLWCYRWIPRRSHFHRLGEHHGDHTALALPSVSGSRGRHGHRPRHRPLARYRRRPRHAGQRGPGAGSNAARREHPRRLDREPTRPAHTR